MRISDWSSDVCSSYLPPMAISSAASGPRSIPALRRKRVGTPVRAPNRTGERRRLRPGGSGLRRHPHGREAFLDDALVQAGGVGRAAVEGHDRHPDGGGQRRSEEHTSELTSLMRISYAVFCLKKKTNIYTHDKIR